jgi:hypothetical protein
MPATLLQRVPWHTDRAARQCAQLCSKRNALHWHALVSTSSTQALGMVWKLITSLVADLRWRHRTRLSHRLRSQWSRTTRVLRVRRQSLRSRLLAGRQSKVRQNLPVWRPVAARDCRTRHCRSARSSTSMLQVRQCPRLIWIASTLMTSMRRLRPIAQRRWLLPAASVAGRLSICSRTSATSCTARDPPSTSETTGLFYLIAPSLSPLSLTAGHHAVSQRGCSPLSTLPRTALVFQSRRTLARSALAVAPKLLRVSAHKAQACGKASYNPNILYENIERPQRGQRRRTKKAYTRLRIPTPHITHTSVYISFSISAHTCVFPYWRTSRTPKSHAT